MVQRQTYLKGVYRNGMFSQLMTVSFPTHGWWQKHCDWLMQLQGSYSLGYVKFKGFSRTTKSLSYTFQGYKFWCTLQQMKAERFIPTLGFIN